MPALLGNVMPSPVCGAGALCALQCEPPHLVPFSAPACVQTDLSVGLDEDLLTALLARQEQQATPLAPATAEATPQTASTPQRRPKSAPSSPRLALSPIASSPIRAASPARLRFNPRSSPALARSKFQRGPISTPTRIPALHTYHQARSLGLDGRAPLGNLSHVVEEASAASSPVDTLAARLERSRIASVEATASPFSATRHDVRPHTSSPAEMHTPGMPSPIGASPEDRLPAGEAHNGSYVDDFVSRPAPAPFVASTTRVPVASDPTHLRPPPSRFGSMTRPQSAGALRWNPKPGLPLSKSPVVSGRARQGESISRGPGGFLDFAFGHSLALQRPVCR